MVSVVAGVVSVVVGVVTVGQVVVVEEVSLAAAVVVGDVSVAVVSVEDVASVEEVSVADAPVVSVVEGAVVSVAAGESVLVPVMVSITWPNAPDATSPATNRTRRPRPSFNWRDVRLRFLPPPLLPNRFPL
jgi:hypothetical protein